MNETNLVRTIMLAMGKVPGVRIFRNNTGTGWIGKYKLFNKTENITVHKGDVVIMQARVFIAGLCPGSSDIIGFKSVIVTPEMVGKRIAIFMAPEIKTASGHVSEDQKNFLNMVNAHGGIGFIAKNADEALQFMNTNR